MYVSRWRELNSRPLPYQGSALPLSYTGGNPSSGRRGSNPRPLAWKANALPTELLPQHFEWERMDSNHRRHSQQIYSLSPLATREFPHIPFAALELVDGLEPPTC